MKLPDLKQVRQIRLLPVVIFASVALLLLKGTGIMTGGGYVLTGPLTVQAAGGGGKAALHDLRCKAVHHAASCMSAGAARWWR